MCPDLARHQHHHSPSTNGETDADACARHTTCSQAGPESSGDAFVAIDRKGRVVDWTAEAERAFGWSPAQVVGRTLADTILAPGPHQFDGMDRLLSPDASPQRARRFDLLARHRQGHVVPVEVTVWAGDNGRHGPADAPGICLFFRELSEQRQVDDERRRLAAIVESTDEAIIGTCPQMRILTWNRGAARVYGYELDEVAGQPLWLITPPEERPQLERLVERAREGTPAQQQEMKGLRKGGVVIDVSLTLSPICDDGGTMTGISVIARDITEQRWMAATLSSTLKSLEAALAEARQSEERYRRFTADAAHQLRTPIAGIRASAETLLHSPPRDEQEALLANVVRETRRAGRLMSGLLQMARLDQGQVLDPKKCDVVALCQEEAERAQAVSPELDVAVVANELPSIRPALDADAVGEILSNLLDNARRHARTRVEVAIGCGGDQLELRVRDDGPGVPPHMTERIFDRFVSADGKGGSGLGLAIGRALARMHGGDLTYDDGAFVLRLPLDARRDCGGAGSPRFDTGEKAALDDWEIWRPR